MSHKQWFIPVPAEIALAKQDCLIRWEEGKKVDRKNQTSTQGDWFYDGGLPTDVN